jgi:RNA polymerase sigma-70 factor (ECF subfamily)
MVFASARSFGAPRDVDHGQIRLSTSLLQSVSTGDPDAVRACIDRFGALVWSLSRRFSPSPSDAEDAAQEIFVELWKSAGRFDPTVASEATFVAMIARRRLVDRQRRRQRRLDTEPLPELPPAAEEGSSPSGERAAEATLAARAVAQLRPEQQKVLLLATYHGLSHEEIASATGMPLGTVKAHARRGLIKVRELLSDRVGPAADGGEGT